MRLAYLHQPAKETWFFLDISRATYALKQVYTIKWPLKGAEVGDLEWIESTN